ncbi:hypothetical protein ACQ4PT_021457 [Festuca glaucescens]
MGTGRRRRLEGDDSDEEYLVQDEEELCTSSAAEEGGGSDAEYAVDEEDDEEEETPRPVKGARKRKSNPAAARSRRRRRYEDDDDYSEEEVEEDEGTADQYPEEDLHEEEPPRVDCVKECGGRGQPPVPERSNQRRREEEDVDFDPDLDEGEEDMDMDFDPELEGDDEECEDEEEEFNLSRTRKTQQRITNTVRRNPASKRPRGTKRKSSSKRKARPAKPRKAASARRRRKRPAAERYEDDDDDFIVEDDDQVEVSRNPRKKARFGRQDRPVPVAEADIWPAVDSDTSDFEFGTSDEEPEDVETPVAEPVRVAARKGRRKKASGASSDSEFHVSDEELRVVREEEVERKKRALMLQSSSDSEYHVSDTQLEASRETASKKSVSSSDSEFNVSDKELRHVRKEAKKKNKKRVFVSGSSSESEFHVSDKELRHVRKEAKKKKNRAFVSGSSSESEFHVSDKDLGRVREGEANRKKRVFVSGSCSDSECHVADKDSRDKPQEAQPTLPVSVRRISLTRNGEDKGKEKKEAVDAGKQMCGICFSEDQRMTPQGMLNCCSHYFCFPCIMEWSKVESRCPLCKRRFTTITKSSKVDLGLELKKTVIRVEERDQVYQPTEEEIRRWLDPYENLVCIECNQGGEDSLMLLCDICDSSAHTYCVGLGREVPEGNWYCGGCRLAGEGPSYPRSLTNSNSAQLASTAPIGIFERSPSINSWQTFQGFDLNASPREISRQNIPAESRASTADVSTPSGGRLATLSRRRGWMRILLNRHRPSVSSDLGHNGVQNSDGVARAEPDRMNFFASSDSNSLQHSGYVSRIEQNHINLHAPLEVNSSQLLLDDIRDQHRFSPSVHTPRNSTPCISVDGNSFPTN